MATLGEFSAHLRGMSTRARNRPVLYADARDVMKETGIRRDFDEGAKDHPRAWDTGFPTLHGANDALFKSVDAIAQADKMSVGTPHVGGHLQRFGGTVVPLASGSAAAQTGDHRVVNWSNRFLRFRGPGGAWIFAKKTVHKGRDFLRFVPETLREISARWQARIRGEL